ncbi:MAG: DNA repair protein RecN [Lachnospiraceae bacterium]|nr:DNA repair protein RecN [Lachnospiraceae bacterium]
MLQSLHVRNIALIDDVEIDFTDGLNILTGETGAGKSILIDSVNFALGERMPKEAVRDENDNALCELVFAVEDEETRKALTDLDVMLTDDQVILQRRIVNGRSSCKVNGENVTASRIREIAEHLIDIHGQHEHQSLLHKKNHGLLLDSFCGEELEQELCKLRDAYDRYKAAEEEYEKALVSKDSVSRDMDYSKFVVGEIESAALNPGEDEKLEEDYRRMNNARKIAELLGSVMNTLSYDSASASAAVSHCVSQLRQISELDHGAESAYEQLLAAEDIITDCIRCLTDYEESLEFSPEDYARTGERLDTINSLKMKYGQTIEQILARLSEEQDKIEKFADYETYLSDLKFKKDQLYDILAEACARASSIRHKEAGLLQKDICEALGNLNFLDARFEITITKSERMSRNGYDEVEFTISTNPGESLKPLANVASGGELSRIMLALKSVLAKRDSIGTMIFDEIDTGISGKTAQLVADRMSDIAKNHQVIAVTHLPQIASHAASHFLIEKSAEGMHTSTKVIKLSYEQSVDELARMMAGSDITEAVRKSAAELKDMYGLTGES